MLVDIDRIPTNADAVIRIYRNRCVISARAYNILGLSAAQNRVRVRQDMEQYERGGRVRIYISRSNSPVVGYLVKKRRNVGQINSTRLCSRLANMLDGYGTYRICEEICVSENNETSFEIFFKKY